MADQSEWDIMEIRGVKVRYEWHEDTGSGLAEYRGREMETQAKSYEDFERAVEAWLASIFAAKGN